MEDSRKYLPRYQEKWLPSNNLQYPDGVNIHYYPFSFGEILKINQSNLDNFAMWKDILEGVDVQGMLAEDLTFYDVVYLGWRRKTSSLGASIVDVISYCPNCDTKNMAAIDLTKLEFVDVNIKAMPIKTKICDIELHFNFITIKNYLELVAKELHTNVLAIYAKSVTNKSYEEAYDIISSATGNDLDKIEVLNTILYHGVKPIDVTCKNEDCVCKYVVEISNSQEAEIVKPFRRQEDVIRDEISFGN